VKGIGTSKGLDVQAEIILGSEDGVNFDIASFQFYFLPSKFRSFDTTRKINPESAEIV
jgi:hypothetical protein